MVRPLQVIDVKGRRVELLFTPSLYGIAQKRQISLTIEDIENYSEVLDVYCKVIYLAAINAWEVRAFDNPDLGEFDLSLMDFILWSTDSPKEFGRMIKSLVECLTGKPFGTAAENAEEVKKK